MIQTPSHWHPSDVAVLGRYAVVADRMPDNELDLLIIDLDNPTLATSARRVRMPKERRGTGGINMAWGGGGIALARLRDGGILYVTYNPGDDYSAQRYASFYRIDGDMASFGTDDVEYLASWDFSASPEIASDYQFSESISIVTECETGQMYLTTSSTDRDPIIERNYLALWKVRWADGPYLEPVDIERWEERNNSCTARASASLGTTSDHRPVVICTDRSPRTENVDFRMYMP